MPKIILHCDNLDDASQQLINKIIHGTIHKQGAYAVLETDVAIAPEEIKQLRMQLPFDINLLPEGFSPGQIKLLITDMDSTLINIECVDEIADFLGIKPQVAAITESAMRGEIDFQTSLRKRVGLLAGLDCHVLNTVYQERLQLNPGAEQLITGLKQTGIKTALVSGGFTFFTERLQQRLGFDYVLANRLAIENDKLTGQVLGDIVDGSVKAGFLEQICTAMHIAPTDAIAMGDGANDLLMMNSAGIGVAYHAKPAVQDKADIVLNHSGLDAVLHLLQIDTP
jgi:phosphoserine phosphatase